MAKLELNQDGVLNALAVYAKACGLKEPVNVTIEVRDGGIGTATISAKITEIDSADSSAAERG